jgi:hypothetical protein
MGELYPPTDADYAYAAAQDALTASKKATAGRRTTLVVRTLRMTGPINTEKIADESVVPMPDPLPRIGEVVIWNGVAREVRMVEHSLNPSAPWCALYLAADDW